MPRSWVTFEDNYGYILAEDVEMDALPRQGEEVIIDNIVYGVYGVKWRILSGAKAYRNVIIYLSQGPRLS